MREMEKLMSQWDVFVSPAPGSASLLITNLTAIRRFCVLRFINNLPMAIIVYRSSLRRGARLRVALAFERATKWHAMHPEFRI